MLDYQSRLCCQIPDNVKEIMNDSCCLHLESEVTKTLKCHNNSAELNYYLCIFCELCFEVWLEFLCNVHIQSATSVCVHVEDSSVHFFKTIIKYEIMFI